MRPLAVHVGQLRLRIARTCSSIRRDRALDLGKIIG